jgi:predicted small lipoprotein YifL
MRLMVFILSVLMIGLVGCGKKGDPVPLQNSVSTFADMR